MSRARRAESLRRHNRRADAVRIALADIHGIDPCNSRQDEPDAASIEALAAVLLEQEQINPLLLRGMPGQGYRVLAGGRRWRALKLLAERGEPIFDVAAVVENCDDARARELSLAENFHHEGLHPLAEAERFAELAREQGVARVARALGASQRFVRQRIALAGLPDEAKDAWRAGRFGIEVAQIMAEADPARVVQLVGFEPDETLYPGEVRNWLKPKGAPASCPEALYVGREAYEAAGGAVIEDLFSDGIRFADKPLLDRLALSKRAEFGAALIEAEGWGEVCFSHADAPPGRVGFDFTPAEAAELEGELSFEREQEILRLGVLRKVPEADRWRYGVVVTLDTLGRPVPDRGVLLSAAASPPTSGRAETSSSVAYRAAPGPAAAEDEREDPDDDADFAAGAAAAIGRPAPAPTDSNLSWLFTRGLWLRAAALAWAEAIVETRTACPADDPLVTMIGLALPGCAKAAESRGPFRLTRDQGPAAPANDLLRRVAAADYDQALTLLFADRSAIVPAFLAMLACSVSFAGLDEATIAAALDGAERQGLRVRERIAAHFPWEATFAAPASPEACLLAIRQAAGAIEINPALSRDELRALAARVCRGAGLLPPFLRAAPAADPV